MRLQIGPSIFPHWTSATVSKRIDAISSVFHLELATNRNIPPPKAKPFSVGDKIGLLLENQPVILGYIDTLELNLSDQDFKIQISGRDNTADLVDCSVVQALDEFRGQSLYQIAVQLCNPVGIPVLPEVDSSPIPNFKVDPGETIFEALERAARPKGLLFRPDGQGNLKLAKIGQKTSQTSLEDGKNILSASARYDHSNRYSDYIVKGDFLGTEEGAIEEKSIDQAIRYRPKLILATNAMASSDALTLAQWEQRVRTARSLRVSIETQGWAKTDGSLWDVNQLIKVISPSLGINDYMLSTGVDFTFYDRYGTRTSIELSNYDAFIPKPVSEVTV